MGARCLGLVPRVRGRRRQMPSDYALEKPHSAYPESIRSVRAGVEAMRLDDLGKVMMVTSARPSEGKSSLAMTLGRMDAGCGQRVVVVDCDMRRPSLHVLAGLPAGLGLAELVSRRCAFRDVVRRDAGSTLDLVLAGSTQDPGAVIGSAGMRELLQTLRADYDVVLLDTPRAPSCPTRGSWRRSATASCLS